MFPDGRVELIVHHGDRFSQIDNGGIRRQPRGLLVGQMTRAVQLQDGPHVGIIAARLRPAAVGVLFPEPASMLTGRVVGLRDVAGAEGDNLVEAVNSATTAHERIHTLEGFLESRVRRTTSPDPQTTAAARLIEERGGQVRIERVADVVALSARHLQRRFIEAVGLAPKQYARIVRFQRALGLLEKGVSLSRTAITCGYYDQPHFSREFQDIAGISPSRFGRGTGPLSEHFIHDSSDSYKTTAGSRR